MFSLALENEKGNRLTLTRNLDYEVIEIDGLYPPSADIITSNLALYDGSKFNSSKLSSRQINISIAIQKDAEKNRIALYNVVKTKQYIKILYKNGLRDVFIDGYVSSMNIDFFAMKQIVTLSVLCPDPYFKDMEELIEYFNSVVYNFTFPFSITATNKVPFSYRKDVLEKVITNKGDVESGLLIELHANGTVKNPTIFNSETREFFSLLIELEAGDVVYITTSRGNKKVHLLRDGKNINIFNSIKKGSTWLQLEPGDNVFTYEVDENKTEYVEVRFSHQLLYEGV